MPVTTTHTPTPWILSGLGFIHSSNDAQIVIAEEPDGKHYRASHAAWPANAAHIVRCVNERTELVEILRELITWDDDTFSDPVWGKARTIITRATQED